MRWHEKLQYKLRDYLYNKNRKAINAKPVKMNPKSTESNGEFSKKENILAFFDEMEDYLEKQVQKNKNNKV